MKLVYEKSSGKILSQISKSQDVSFLFRNMGLDLDKIDVLFIDKIIDINSYYVANKQIIKYNELEASEIELYGRVLTEEERQLEKLKPSQKEVAKAENTIEILTLIQEVI